jgi:hypothetical protein
MNLLATSLPSGPIYLAIAGVALFMLALGAHDLDRFGRWLIVGGWGLFALTSPSAEFPHVLRPLSIIAIGVGVMLHLLRRPPESAVPTRRIAMTSRFLFVYAVFVMFGCMASPFGLKNLDRWIQGVIIIGGAFYGVALALGPELVAAVFAAASVNMVLTFLQPRPEVDHLGNPTGRLAGFMQPNHLAFCAAEVLIGVAWLYPRRPHVNLPFFGRTSARPALLVLALISGYVLYKSQSRTGLVGFLVAVFIAWLTGEHVRGRRTKIFVWSVAIGLILLPLSTSAIVSYLNRDKSTSSVTSLTGRTDFWPLAVDLIEQRPLIGWGVNVILSPVGEKFQEVLPGVNSAHNAFLEAGLQSGLIGLVAFACALFGLVIGALRLPRDRPYRFLLVAAAVLTLFYSFTESQSAWFGDMFVVFTLALAMYSEEIQTLPGRAKRLVLAS